MALKQILRGNTFVGRLLPYVLAVLAAFGAAGIFIALMGFNVLEAYQTILFTSLSFKFENTN